MPDNSLAFFFEANRRFIFRKRISRFPFQSFFFVTSSAVERHLFKKKGFPLQSGLFEKLSAFLETPERLCDYSNQKSPILSFQRRRNLHNVSLLRRFLLRRNDKIIFCFLNYQQKNKTLVPLNFLMVYFFPNFVTQMSNYTTLNPEP